ncbi:MAG: GNAT family N-acetyltransferase [Phycisphaerales bacterium]
MQPCNPAAAATGHHDRADGLPIRLRPTRPGDLPALFELQCDPECNAMAGTKPRTREAFFAAWEGFFGNPNINGRVIETDGEGGPQIVGRIACFQADGANCVGYWIARQHWGKGIASRALAMFLQEEPRRPLHATTDSGNATSRHILAKRGFRFMGLRMGEETDRFLAREIAEYVLTS